MSVKLYIEGGGNGQLLDTLFRQGWQQFFRAAGLAGRMPGVVRGQGRTQTLDLFATAVANPRGGTVPLLLVDSEDPIDVGHSVWQHLKARERWERPASAADDQAFLMVQVMETWFLSDRGLLASYFGKSLREQHLRQWPNLEAVPKRTVFDALEMATAGCDRHYAKGRVSYELLGKLSPPLVEAPAPTQRHFWVGCGICEAERHGETLRSRVRDRHRSAPASERLRADRARGLRPRARHLPRDGPRLHP